MAYFANGSFQLCVAGCSGISVASVCKIVRTISTVLCGLVKNYIKFPEPNEITDLTSNFFKVYGFPGVVGCIDGSYINILNPGGDDAELYKSQKGRCAINVMAVCDHNLKFLNIICSWPGSVHDSRILDNSRVCQLLEEGNYDGYLLGDSEYPCRKYLLTPVLSPTTENERRYNVAHMKTWNAIQRTFGVWKCRFAILNKEMRTKLPTTKKIIMACAILHNIARDHNIPLPDVGEEHFDLQENENLEGNGGEEVYIENAESGLALRKHIIDNWF